MDPARPSRMTVAVKSLRLEAPEQQQHQPPASSVKLCLKLRKDAVWISNFSPPDVSDTDALSFTTADSANLIMTFHCQMFDTMKVDLYFSEGSTPKLLSVLKSASKFRARGRMNFTNFPDWHWGSYSALVDLLPPKSKNPVVNDPRAIAKIELVITFSPLLLQNEEMGLIEDPSTDLKDYLLQAHKYESSEESEAEEPSAQEVSASDSRLELKVANRKTFLRSSTYRDALEKVRSAGSIPSDKTAISLVLRQSEDLRASPEPDALVGEETKEGKPASNGTKLFSRAMTAFQSKGNQSSKGQSVRKASLDASAMLNSRELDTERKSASSSKENVDSRRKSASIRIPKPKLVSDDTYTNMLEINDVVSSLLKSDFDMPLSRVVKVVRFLYRFENGLNIPRTGIPVKDITLMKTAVRFMDHSLIVYGAAISGFFRGSISLKENLRTRADEKTAVEYLGLKIENVLYWDYSKRSISSTRYFIIHDTTFNSIVISIQGTITPSQIFTDINADYYPVSFNKVKGGVHKAMMRAAQSIFDEHLEQILGWCKSLGVNTIVCTGHSLGAGTAALLTLLLHERLANGPEGITVHGHCFAPPGAMTRELAESCTEFIDSYVMENDIVPHLSFGSVFAFKELLFRASDVMDKNLPETEAFALLQIERENIIQKNKDKLGVLPGRVFHIFKTIRRVPRRHQGRHPSLFTPVYKSVPLPESESPEVPHYVIEQSEASFFSSITPRRHLLNHHMPWQYTKAISGALLAITTSNLVASSSSENIRSASLLTSKEDNATMALLNKMTILQGQILAFEQEKLERELEHKAKELELKKQRSDREFEMWERDFQLRKEEFEWRKQNAIRDTQFPASTSIKTIAPPPQPTESLPVAVPRDIPLQIDFQVSLPQNQLEEKPKKIFISYSWHNSRTEKLKEGLAEEELANVGIWDPRVHSRNLIKSLGYDPWLDVEQLEVGKKLEGQLADVLSDEVSMVLVHASDEYAASTNCKKEFEFAMDLGLKILPIVVGPEPSNDQNGKPKQTSGSKTKPWSKGWLGFSINHVLYVDARREQQLQAATQAIGEAIAKEMKSLYQTTEKMSAENIKTIRDAILSGNENLLADLVRKHSEDVNADVEGSPSILELCTTKASLASIKLLVEAGLKLTHQGVAPLNLAVKRGDVAILACLLDLGAEVNRLDDNGSSALHIAAAFASPTEINILVNHGANLEIKNSQGSTPLLVACSALKLDNMKALKEFGANVNAENSSGENALHLVCKIDGADIEIVKYLLDSNVSVVKGDDDNWYPADRAAEKNRVDIIQEMFKTANVADECYVLHSAAEAGSLDVVRYLTSKECPNKVDLFEEDGSGWTPIDAAVRNGRLEVVKYLVELDKSVLKERPKHLKSLMFVAAEENEPEVLKYLLTEAKVHYDIEETDDDGWTALHYMIWKGGYECIDILLKKDPHLLTLVTENGRSVIGWAAFYGRLQLVETIIKVDHDVKEKIWRKDDNGNNVFHLALWSKNFEVVKVIGELDDTIVASKTKSGINALQIAAKIGSIEIFKYLLEHPKGAFDIHEVDSEGYSLLAKAILSNNLEMVKLVTELDPTLASFKTGKNECMVSVAARASSLDILKYLLAIPDVSFNLKEVDDDGNNIFMNAIASNNTFVLSHLVSLDSTLLLSRGAKDMSPPCYAAYCNAFESFKFLVNQPTHQYDLAETNEKNWSAMTFAVANACLEIVEILHSKSDGLINIKSAGNKNLLHVLLDQVSDKVEGDDTSTKESPNDENTLECLKFLVDKGSFNLSDVSDEGFTPLAYAIQSGYTDCVKFLVKKDPTTLQIKPYDGSTLLHLCFYDDDYDDCLDFLLENYKDYFDLSARNAEECTVLEAAVVNNAVECVKYLADFDSSLLEVRPFGLTLMEFAAAQRGTDVFSFLLDYASASSSESDDDDEADEDGEDGEDDEDDEENDNSEDENEVEDSADDEANDEDEKSSKSGKKNGGTAEKAKAKVDNDTEESKAEESASNKLTDPRDMSDEELVSLLTFACLGGSEVIAKKLLLNFKKLSKRINVKKTPASERPKFSEKSQLIFDVLCTLRNDQAAQRALSFGYALGAWNHNVDLLNSLKFLNVPFDPTVEWLGGNPFYYYSDEVYEILYSLEPTYTLASAKLNQSVFYSMVGEHEGLLKWAKYVLAHGADPNLQLNQFAIFPERAGFTALHRACQTGRVDALEFLFTVEQVDFKVTDCEGSTPLHILAANPYWDNKIINSLVKRFLEHGAVINAVNNAGCTALDVAEKTRTAYGRKQQNRMEMCLRMYGGRPAASL